MIKTTDGAPVAGQKMEFRSRSHRITVLYRVIYVILNRPDTLVLFQLILDFILKLLVTIMHNIIYFHFLPIFFRD